MGQLPKLLTSSHGHAYILEGEPQERLAAGRAYAKGLNCLVSSACDECISCRVFDSGNHPDIFYITGTKATGIGVDDVRDQIIMPMMTQPFKYKYKIFIVDKAETLTPAAQNALLKTIEEPRPYGVFLFLATHVHTLLPTLLSRCVLVKLGEKIRERDAELLRLAEEIASSIEGLDILDAMNLYRRFEPYKENRESVAELLDMLYLSYAKWITENASQGGALSQLWFDSITAIRYTKQTLAQNGNFQLAIELMLLKLNGKMKEGTARPEGSVTEVSPVERRGLGQNPI